MFMRIRSGLPPASESPRHGRAVLGGATGRIALAAFAVMLPSLAHAQDTPACAPPSLYSRGAGNGGLIRGTDPRLQNLQDLLDKLPLCQKDPLFLATLGQLLNAQGRFLDAADHLERALLLAPELKDAQLSYAIALAGSGDPVSANAMLDNLLADPALPADLRASIASQKQYLGTAQPLANGWQSRITLATRLGYDSNLLGSPNLSSLALTLAGQTLVLPLDEGYLARPGAYMRADAQLEARRTEASGAKWDLLASLRSRYSPAVTKADSTQADFQVERSHFLPPANIPLGTFSVGSYVNASAANLQSKAGTRYSALGANAGLGITWRASSGTDCRLRLGAEAQKRDYADNPLLSGRYKGVSLFGACDAASGAQWLAGLKAGSDIAQDPLRVGGNQQQASLRIAGYLPLREQRAGGLLFDLEGSRQADSTGYSPLLEDGVTRIASRRAARLEYQYPVSPSARWLLGTEWVTQTSNLVLFRMSSRGVYTGVRLSW